MVRTRRKQGWLLGLSIALLSLLVLALGTFITPSIAPSTLPSQSQSPAQSQPTSASTPIAAQSTDAGYRELVERLLSIQYGDSVYMPDTQSSASKIQLLPGQLPSNFPLTLSSPDGSRLIGSLASNQSSMGTNWIILLDAPGTPANLSDFYKSSLEKQGWKARSLDSFRSGGFNSVFPLGSSNESSSSNFTTYCPNTGNSAKVAIDITINPTGSALNGLRIEGRNTEMSMCADNMQSPLGGQTGSGPGSMSLIPDLTAPLGVQMGNTSGGSNGNTWYWSATANSSQSVSSLEAHYAKQLQSAKWTLLDGRNDGPLAWSTWKLPGDKNLQGFLYVLSGPGDNLRQFFVQVQSDAPAGSTEWATTFDSVLTGPANAPITPTPKP